MPKESLHAFDVALSGYVCGQLRAHLADLSERPTSATRVPPHGWDNLAVSAWMGWAVATLPIALSDHIWGGVAGDARHRPLSDEELGDIMLAVDDPPRRSESSAVWWACEWVHRRHVECLPTIRSLLSGPTADEWATSSIRFGTTLTEPGLPLCEGVEVVWAWLRDLRRLRQTIQEGRAGSNPEVATSPNRQPTPHDGGGSDDLPKAPVCDWREAMAVTGLKKTKLYDLFRNGRLKGYRDGGMIRFYRTGLMSYMKEQEITTAPPTTRAQQRKLPARRPAAGTRFKFL